MQLLLPLLIVALIVPLHCAEFHEYLSGLRANYDGDVIDQSAAAVCFSVSGDYVPVDSNKLEHGFTCEAQLPAWSADDEHAKEMCTSQFPYQIVDWQAKGDKTRCKFLITTKCEDGFYQIYNSCYKVDDAFLVTYEEAVKHCKTFHSGKPEARIAEFTSPNMEIDLQHMRFPRAWVQVPDLSPYFDTFPENVEGAVFVLDSAAFFETESAKLVMFDAKSKHPPMCQYTPPISPAQMNWLAEQYKEIYPIVISANGAASSTSSYYTTNYEKACEAVGFVIGVESRPVPMDSFEVVTGLLKNHRYQHTTEQDFVFNQFKAVEAFVGARAPVVCALSTFTFSVGACPDDWIPYPRGKDRVFCHKHFENRRTRDYAVADCARHGARLSGFESMHEIHHVIAKNDKVYDYDHHWIGAHYGCNVAGCIEGKHTVSWEEGTSTNLDLLLPTRIYLSPTPGVHMLHVTSFMEFHAKCSWINHNWDYYWCGKWPERVVQRVWKLN